MNYTEAAIEQKFIQKLIDLKYTHRPDITDKKSLEKNFREKFERLNGVHLTDSEFERLKLDIITPDVFAAAKMLRETHTFIREDDVPLHYTLVNIKDWCKNDYEVISQLRINTENSHRRYDVILLINGIPVVQIELKTLQIPPKKAIEQIIEYKNDTGNGYTNSLLCFMQLFIVSNESSTYYFANNQNKHFAFAADERFLPVYRFADESNRKINHLSDFADKFLEKCTLGRMISRYMVLVVSEQKLLMMRPYQIYAVKAIVDCIQENRGNGYIWHTTGSGKTLTSFKAATLLKDNRDIDKCLFVVDRKDLDRQTREEFNRFQQGCVEENTHTHTLVNRLLSNHFTDKVIVTTIQKLGLALKENGAYRPQLSRLKNKRMIFIFDECHRSQFGQNHQAIKNFFPNSQLFGFTGTPIFEENASYKRIDGTDASYQTTEDIFEKQLHAYTITNAIDDGNVLKFHIDYYKAENTKGILATHPVTKQAIVDSILKKHDTATGDRRFNALFATASINDAVEYQRLFKAAQAKLQASNPDFVTLNIACVFSPPAEGDKDIAQIQADLPQEEQDNKNDPSGKKAALKAIIDDYNNQYGTHHSINEFDQYYQDVQKRIKDHQYPDKHYPHQDKIDITIVVDMLLTGFDSKYLNTLYVDKNLKYHGLIQAFSRTNRVLNAAKPYGNILDFRGQQDQVDEAIKRFSGQDQERAREIWIVDPAETVMDKLQKTMSKLQDFMSSHGLACTPSEAYNLKGDTARAGFINLFKEVQRCKTQLGQYTDLSEEQQQTIEAILPDDTQRAFKGVYLDMAQQIKLQNQQKNRPLAPELEQLDFEFVLFASAVIDYDYIMKLIADNSIKPKKQQMSRTQLVELIAASSDLMDEKDDIIAYIDSLKTGEALSEKEVKAGYQAFRQTKNNEKLTAISQKYGILGETLSAFVGEILNRMIFDGEKLTDLLAPLELSWKERRIKELALMEELVPLLKNMAKGKEISGLKAYE
ncbi:type I restriction enzyme R subunit [Nicoletella semolina]|uniref:Type I restriction enzyme endonuclease subunit n=1 Tax=Nicoletella semolina TaxID=271160 RepID=A0A4R2N723_9PAST|nr:type I restriction endonuclease subunit R [Nicoletella semolina]MDH2924705.1 DEAD/DEAH box helicase [Nicoletella semolina]TCP16671.1 type I restriction enzyme R subunit [Nicoletella semolina]